ncbi:MAG: DsrE/DsrF/TusD sulfur relay family protein [Promethearchaeota archaeon]
MASIGVIIGTAPYTAERAYTALRFINTAILDEHPVKLFLVEDGVFVGLNNQNPTEYPNLVDWMNQAMETGELEVKACGVCLKARGVTKDALVKGIEIGTMHDFVSYVADTDKSVFF